MWIRYTLTKSLLVRTLIVVLIAFFLASAIEITKGKAQESSSNMASFLQQLDKKIKEDPQFLVAISFNTPVDTDPTWVLPSMGEGEDRVFRNIEEIGLDYVCFTQTGGTTKFLECTPFTNIASIRYLIE